MHFLAVCEAVNAHSPTVLCNHQVPRDQDFHMGEGVVELAAFVPTPPSCCTMGSGRGAGCVGCFRLHHLSRLHAFFYAAQQKIKKYAYCRLVVDNL